MHSCVVWSWTQNLSNDQLLFGSCELQKRNQMYHKAKFWTEPLGVQSSEPALFEAERTKLHGVDRGVDAQGSPGGVELTSVAEVDCLRAEVVEVKQHKVCGGATPPCCYNVYNTSVEGTASTCYARYRSRGECRLIGSKSSIQNSWGTRSTPRS